MNATKPLTTSCLHAAAERLMDLLTLAIAYLYWKVCDLDDRAMVEKIRLADARSCGRASDLAHGEAR